MENKSIKANFKNKLISLKENRYFISDKKNNNSENININDNFFNKKKYQIK